MKISFRADATRLQVRLVKAAPKLVEAIRRIVARVAYMVEARTKEKLSGPVLNVRSGRLRRSIHTELHDTPGGARAKIGTNVVYARIHEFGGTIPAHVVEALRGSVLRFRPKGAADFIYRPRAEIPAIQMPERSFLRSALRELAPKLIAELQDAVREAHL